MNMEMAERILQLRKSSGYSQEELADKIGVSRQAVSKWESGQSMPDLDKIIMISDLFEVTTDYILKGTKTDPSEKDRSLNNHLQVRLRFLYPGIVLFYAAATGIIAFALNRFSIGECFAITLAGAAVGMGMSFILHAFLR